jgi:hypothetical protein
MLNSAARQKQGTLARRMDERAGEPNTGMALAMLNAFGSVGAQAFDLTMLDIEGREQGFQRNRSLGELRGFIGRRLVTAAELRYSLVIRPRSTIALLVQLDDFTAARAARGRYWPDYQQALRGAPLKGDGTRDRSLADFMFCKWAAERGWSIEETAVERARSRRQALKGTARP